MSSNAPVLEISHRICVFRENNKIFKNAYIEQQKNVCVEILTQFYSMSSPDRNDDNPPDRAIGTISFLFCGNPSADTRWRYTIVEENVKRKTKNKKNN